MKKELQQQLDGFKIMFPGCDIENHPQHDSYLRLKAALQEANKVPKSQWNDDDLHKQMNEAADKLLTSQ